MTSNDGRKGSLNFPSRFFYYTSLLDAFDKFMTKERVESESVEGVDILNKRYSLKSCYPDENG